MVLLGLGGVAPPAVADCPRSPCRAARRRGCAAGAARVRLGCGAGAVAGRCGSGEGTER